MNRRVPLLLRLSPSFLIPKELPLRPLLSSFPKTITTTPTLKPPPSPHTQKHSNSHSFYDTTVSQYAQQPALPVTLEHLIALAQLGRQVASTSDNVKSNGDNGNVDNKKSGNVSDVGEQRALIESAQWLRRELPVRLARRVRGMCNSRYIEF